MKRYRRVSGPRVLFTSFAISALVHLILAFPLKDLVEKYLNAQGESPSVRVVQLSQKQWAKNFQAQSVQSPQDFLKQKTKKTESARAKPKNRPKPIPKKKVPVKPDRQVVNVPPTPNDAPNPDAKYLSKYNTHVKEQSVARMRDRDHRQKRVTNKLQTKNRLAAPKKGLLNKTLQLSGDGSLKDFLEKSRSRELKLPNILKREKLELGIGIDKDPLAIRQRKGSQGLLGNSDRLELSLGGRDKKDGGKKGPKTQEEKELPPVPTLSALVPTLGRKGRLSGSPSMDYVQGVREGDGTYLNTKEFKYATFIHRVSDSVYPFWDSYLHTEYRRRDPSRRIYGLKDRATVVHLEIGPSGEVSAVQVQESSGVTFLDDVIVRAIEVAQPFPNPPEAMADEDGIIRLSYRFVVVLRPGRGALFRGLP
jgi:TonB family protein